MGIAAALAAATLAGWSSPASLSAATIAAFQDPAAAMASPVPPALEVNLAAGRISSCWTDLNEGPMLDGG